MRIPSGVTDQVIYFVAQDSNGNRLTGLTTFTVYRSRNTTTATAMTTPTVTEVSAANMPGVYTLLLDEDMTIEAGNDTEAMLFHISQSSMRDVSREIELYRPKITAGETVTASSGVVEGNTVQISGSATAADNLEAHALGVIPGLAQTGTLSTTVMTTDITGFLDNELIGRVVVWTGGIAAGQASDITDYASASGTVTYTAITTAPANNDPFVIV